jgi:hypothetical protein
MPEGHDLTEFVVRVFWVSCEFAMRSAVFLALWRLQTSADRRWALAFFGLVAVHWVVAIISFARATEAYTAWWNAQPVALLLLRVSPWLGISWLAILVSLNHRVQKQTA